MSLLFMTKRNFIALAAWRREAHYPELLSGMANSDQEPPMTMTQTTDVYRLQASFAKSIHDHWVLFLIEGIALLILGLLAILIPPLATLGITIVLGWLFLFSGIAGLITTFGARHAPGFW
jgi:hypothetical protein